MVPIVYGYPTEEMIQQSREDKIVLGGIKIKRESHYCLSCNEAQVVDYTL
jgi:hypothetical protein